MVKKAKLHSVKYNFIMNFILTASNFIFPLITFPYVSRILGPGPNGKISFATAVISYFSLVAMMGIPTYGVRKVAEVRDDPEKLNVAVTELLVLNIIFTLISYFVLVILIGLIPKFRNNSLLIGITSISIIFTTLGVDWFYQGIEQYDYITYRNLLFKVISIILMFIFVHNPSDYILYAGITVVANVGSNILNIINLHNYVHLRFIDSFNFKQHLKPIFLLFLYSATTVIYTNLDQVMLGFMVTNKELGFYSATVKIENILTSVITSLGAVMIPRVTYCLNHNHMERFNQLINKSFSFIVLISSPLMCFSMIEALPAIQLIAGTGYDRAATILVYIMPSIVFVGLSSVTAWEMLIPMKMESWTVIGAVIGATMNLCLNFLLIPHVGAIGAAAATSFAEFGVLGTHLFILRKTVFKLIDFKDALKVIVAALLASGALFVYRALFPYVYISTIRTFWVCVITGVIYFGVFGIVLLISKEKLVYAEIGRLLERFN